MTIEIKMPHRAAEVNINAYWAKRHNIEEGTTPCFMLGLFQDSTEDGPYPVAVCELLNGKVVVVAPDLVTFLKEED